MKFSLSDIMERYEMFKLSILMSILLTQIVVFAFERVVGRFVVITKVLGFGLYFIICPIILGIFYSEISSWFIQLTNSLGLTLVFTSFWLEKRKQEKEGPANQVSISTEAT